jgi:molybdopterin biosynthesis enzyme
MFDIDLAQRVLLQTATPALRTEEVPLSKAVGRVLAEPLALRRRDAPGERPVLADEDGALDAGIRLQSKHVPHLASTGRPTVRVFHKLKVGVLSLGEKDEPATADGPPAANTGLAGPMLASLLDGLGTIAIAAPRVIGDEKAVRSVLDMLLNECRIVLVAGCASEARRGAVHEVLRARDADRVDWTLCEELGTQLSVATLGDRVVVCLPGGLAESFMAFMLLISPLIRRLQGRTHPLPASPLATVRRRRSRALVRGCFLWAHETGTRSELAVHPHLQERPVDAIAQSDGIARSADASWRGETVHARYYPFATWLQ